jgi:hypothetical protein
MITTTQFDMFIAENEKSFVITKAKVASRYLQEIYQPDVYNVPLNINFEFSDINSLSDNQKNIFYRLSDIKQNKKDILLLYRNPIKRYISGTIEDLFVSIGTTNFNEKYFLRRYLNSSNIEPYFFFKQLEENIENKNFLLEDSYNTFLTSLLEDWFVWQNSTSAIISHHSSPYLAIYDSMLNHPNIDRNKIKFINIDDPENNLTRIFQNYSKDVSDVIPENTNNLRQSNKSFFTFVKKYIEDNIAFSQLMNDVCQMDLYFYQKFESLPNNIKNIK